MAHGWKAQPALSRRRADGGSRLPSIRARSGRSPGLESSGVPAACAPVVRSPSRDVHWPLPGICRARRPSSHIGPGMAAGPEIAIFVCGPAVGLGLRPADREVQPLMRCQLSRTW
jgi:hypothetical protein